MLVCFRQKQLQPEGYPQFERKTVGTQAEIHTAPTVKSVLIFTNYKIISYGNKNERERVSTCKTGEKYEKFQMTVGRKRRTFYHYDYRDTADNELFFLCEVHIGRVQTET